jgi:hypothetical protein
MKPRPFLLLLFIFLSFQGSFAQQSDPFQIKLRNTSFSPARNISEARLKTMSKDGNRQQGKLIAILQFEQLPTSAQLLQMRADGIELGAYISGNAYIAAFTGELDGKALRKYGARAVVPFRGEYKLEPKIAGLIGSAPTRSTIATAVWVKLSSFFDPTTCVRDLQAKNFAVTDQRYLSYGIIELNLTPVQIQRLADLPCVEYIQTKPGPDLALNNKSIANSQANVLRSSLPGQRALSGEGIVVGVGDDGSPAFHVDLAGKSYDHSASTGGLHGIHVMGTVGGMGIRSELQTGYAPSSKIVAQLFSNILLYTPTYVQDYGMLLTNNSYGNVVDDCAQFGIYDLYSQLIDRQLLQFQSLQHVFATGNSGVFQCASFPQGYGTVLGGYQTSKNAISVGNTEDNGEIAPKSSRGPVFDGRIKPDIAAQGQVIYSTSINNGYGYNSGTSMAAPAVTGGLALLYERYKQLHAGANPPNYLMKALLLNGATDRGIEGPDFIYGFGWMNLLESVRMLERGQFFLNAAAPAQPGTHQIQIPAGSQPSRLKVMLYWNDAEASPLSSANLINDLDLTVTTPGGQTLNPLVLQPGPSQVMLPATPGTDRVNNVEQVVLNNPQVGTYQVQINVHRLAAGASQPYVLVFDTLSQGLELTHPIGGEKFDSPDSVYVTWKNYSATGTVELEYTTDGFNWIPIANSIPALDEQYKWQVPAGVASKDVRVRITESSSGSLSVSEPFIIVGVPVVSLAAVQCDSYIAIGWPVVTGATDYEVMISTGQAMRSAATTATNSYTLAGLSRDSIYYVAVRARVNGAAGRRGVSVIRGPNNGTCAGTISNGDFRMISLLAPASGRLGTSKVLGASEQIRMRIRNLDDALYSGSLQVGYRINQGTPVITNIPTVNVAANGFYTFTSPVTANLSAVGQYELSFWVSKPGDPVAANDTMRALIKQLPNDPVDISNGFLEDMEQPDVFVQVASSMGLPGMDRFDLFTSSNLGRARNFVSSGMAYSGTKALTLDVSRYAASGNIDSLTATFNLAAYDGNMQDLRLDFQYLQHGQQPHPANRVWVRGNDQLPWLQVYDLESNQPDAGLFKRSESLEISDLLIANGQQFTSSFQVKWGQWGQYIAADPSSAAGYSFDDIRLYMVSNDIQMIAVDTPVLASCGLDAQTPVRVRVRNSANSPIANIPVSYRVDGGTVQTEVIPVIAGNSTITYEFAARADLSQTGTYAIKAWVALADDSFNDNDSTQVVLRNSPVLSDFPYLQDFENGAGNWFAVGKNSSWEFGLPASIKIRTAASGNSAWKTKLAGTYNDAELSYLYSPCFDLSGMASPMLSFSMALDIEDCGASTQCDAAWVEYSTDGRSWQRLGSFGTGVNWYNRNYTDGPVWSKQDYTNWHVASALLPAGVPNLRLRFVMKSDPYVSREGVAIDDIHIFDRSAGIFNDPVLVSNTVSENANSDDWIPFYDNGKIMAALHTRGNNLGSAAVTTHLYDGAVRDTNNSYYLNRNFAIATNDDRLADSVDLRLYFTDLEVKDWIGATGCVGCPQPVSAYQLGVAQYAGSDRSEENGTIDDNAGTRWWWIPNSRVRIVPYDIGYYAEFKVGRLSEFWLSAGRLDGVPAPSVSLQSFTATLEANQQVRLQWNISPEFNMDYYQVEMARGNDAFAQNQFETIGELVSQGNTGAIHSYEMIDSEPGKTGVRYYRIKMLGLDGSVTYSDVKAVIISAEIEWQLYPNPSNGAAWVMYQLNEGEKWQATIYDLQGRRVLRREFTGSGFVQKLEWNLSSLAPGLYLVEMSGAGVKKTVKLVRQ